LKGHVRVSVETRGFRNIRRETTLPRFRRKRRDGDENQRDTLLELVNKTGTKRKAATSRTQGHEPWVRVSGGYKKNFRGGKGQRDILNVDHKTHERGKKKSRWGKGKRRGSTDTSSRQKS